ncbi:MAG TPA: NAD(P)-binding domain-containing protein [Blastocatellia bacterium]|nr:NAD(P)-binding domain-containing protein [Blastocatellia bacterium]
MMYDLIIVGGGPAGLAAALAAKSRRLSYLVLERGSIANTIAAYPLARLLFSTSDEVELEEGALRRGVRPTREELLQHYISIAEREEINIRTGEGVERVAKTGRGFLIDTTTNRYSSRTVLVAIGGFGRPRKLDVPGEDPLRVSYQFVEAQPYAMRPVLVVGGGNSAAEAALDLAAVGSKVVLSFRQYSASSSAVIGGATSTPGSSRIKPWVLEPLERAASQGLIRIVAASRVEEIRRASAVLRVGAAEDRLEVECDQVFALIGADADTRLLEEAGAEIAADGRPVYDSQTYETTAPGLYVAGHITRDLHMKNAGSVARRVVDHLACRLLESQVAREACPTN